MLKDRAHEDCDSYDLTILEELEEKVSREGDCLIWQGLTHGSTPVRCYRGKRRSIRQLIYLLTSDPGFEGRLQQSCGTDHCINPDHISRWEGPGHGVVRPSALSVDQKAEILATPPVRGTGKRLAERMGVSPSMISKVRQALKAEIAELEDKEIGVLP